MYSAIWAYPWDLLDEGLDSALGRIADAGLNGVSVATAYHHLRALCPHNPKRAVYHAEGGVIYFRPEPQFFEDTKIQPVVSELAAESDPLAAICEAAAGRGLKVHAWTVLHHNSRLGSLYPDCTIENAFGDRYPFGLCPSNPDVRAYTVALVGALAVQAGLDTIELESLGFMGIDHSGHHSKSAVDLDPLHRFLLSLCFCPHCSARMESAGVAVAPTRALVMLELRGYFSGRHRQSDDDPLGALQEILGEVNAEGILAARDDSVLSLLEELYWILRESQTLSIMVSGSPLSTGAHAGVTLSQAREYADRLLHQAFHRETGAIQEAVSDVAVRRGSRPLFAGLQAIHPFVETAEELGERVTAVQEAGAEGVQFYHYGLMPLANLDWIRSAMGAL